MTSAVVSYFIQQYPPLRIKPNADCHDRLIVLDYGLPTEQAFHCGASSKDAGKKATLNENGDKRGTNIKNYHTLLPHLYVGNRTQRRKRLSGKRLA